MNLYPDSVNQCSFSFIMSMPSVCKQPPGIGFGPKAGKWDLVYPLQDLLIILLLSYISTRTGAQIVQLLNNSDTLF